MDKYGKLPLWALYVRLIEPANGSGLHRDRVELLYGQPPQL